MLTSADAPVPALVCHTSESASVGLWSAGAAVDDVGVTLLGGGSMTQKNKITCAPVAQIPVTLDQVGHC